MSKTSMLLAGAVGYVLGARAGRERYDQIVDQAQRVWSNPGVQKATRNAQDLAREKAPIVGDKLAGAAKSSVSSDGSDNGSGGDLSRDPGSASAQAPIATTPPLSAEGPIVT
jgi:SLT domain-containing protein